jgi:hypothetical protein
MVEHALVVEQLLLYALACMPVPVLLVCVPSVQVLVLLVQCYGMAVLAPGLQLLGALVSQPVACAPFLQLV